MDDQMTEVMLNLDEAIRHPKDAAKPGHRSAVQIIQDGVGTLGLTKLNIIGQELAQQHGAGSLLEIMGRKENLPARDVAEAATLLSGGATNQLAFLEAVELRRKLDNDSIHLPKVVPILGSHNKDNIRDILAKYHSTNPDMGAVATVFAEQLGGKWMQDYVAEFGPVLSADNKREFLGHLLVKSGAVKEEELSGYGLCLPTQVEEDAA